MPGGYRWMYQMTGLPGWARFGYSPGWGGMPPGAQFLAQSGLMPQFLSWMQSQMPYPSAQPMMSPSMPYSPYPMSMTPPLGMPQMSKEQEVQFLQSQAKALEGQLEQIKRRIEELEKE
jgi:hypothetical protein